MPPLQPSSERRRLHAPRQAGELLAIPPLTDMPAAVAMNREQIATWTTQVLGKPLGELRQLARQEVMKAAERFVASVPNLPARSCPVEKPTDVPLIVSGHQPELFHPGVWAKNFVLNHLAKTTGGIGLHLIVDNDAVSSTRVAVPVGSREAPRIEFIPFDVDAGALPWEEARLRDASLFRTFADRVSASLTCWSIQPMLTDLWPVAVECLAHAPSPRLSDLLTVVRRAAEQRLGLNNLELPISQLCESESFAWFVASLLSDPQQTHAIYNEVVAEYRQRHGIRNSQHPVPDLSTREDGWLEAPFWVWRAGDSHRGRLFVRASSSGLQLANAETIVATLPHIAAESAEVAVAELRALSSRGWKLRPRALTNTLFVRTFLADAFLHGIGGAKYDEMTDVLIARLFDVTPASFLTVTATHHLPLTGWSVVPSDVSKLKHRLWDFDHNFERHTASVPDGEHLTILAEKQRLIAEQHDQDSLDRNDPNRGSHADNQKRRHRFKGINRQLAALAHNDRSALAHELQAVQSQLSANNILLSREFSFGVFPWNHASTFAQITNPET